MSPRRMQKLFAPYNGADLAWHPVTPKMSNPRFQASWRAGPMLR